MSSSETNHPYHRVIILGSGPAGLTAALYAARAALEPLVFEGSVTAGGALMNTTEVENFPGFPDGIQGPELMEALQKQAEKFGAEVLWDDVTEMNLTGTVKTLRTGGGDEFTAHAVVLATGSAYRELGLPDEKRLSGRGVSWCATCDGFFFRDQEIVVVGGGDSAVEEATFLTRFASKVTMVHRRGQLRASKIMADRAKNDPKIEFAWNSEVVAIHGENKVTGVTLRDTRTGEERELHLGDVVPQHLGAELLGLLLHGLHQLGALDAVGEAGEVLDLGRVHQRPTGRDGTGDHERRQAGAGRVDGGRVAGRSGAHDDHVAGLGRLLGQRATSSSSSSGAGVAVALPNRS